MGPLTVVFIQQILRYRQTMFTVDDRAELPGSFRPQPLTTQVGGNGFDVVLRQFVSETRRTITLFYLSEYITDSSITDEPELLARAWLMVAQTPDIPQPLRATRSTRHMALTLNSA